MAVALRAMSVFCPHCTKRVILENYRIRTYHATREFSTCGDILVESRGIVHAPIHVDNLTVKGRVHGSVHARGRVLIDRTGQMRGDVRASHLVVVAGGVINGYCHVEPEGRQAGAVPKAPLAPAAAGGARP